jgi:hypothetical protein
MLLHIFFVCIFLPFLFLGDPFIGYFRSNFNYVADNKRQRATIFINHLIEIGAMSNTFPPGPSFMQNKEKLRTYNQKGNFSLHNARNLVEKSECFKFVNFKESGKKGIFICNLRYVCRNRHKYKFQNKKNASF